MRPIHSFVFFLASLRFFLPTHELQARALVSNGGGAVSLDSLIRTYAYKSLVQPRTGTVYAVQLPPNITGIRASVVRLRSGSLQKRGLSHLHEFSIPSGFKQEPFPLRIALVYQDLGNWSSVYYSLPGYRLLKPVVGLLAYDATDLASTQWQEVKIVATERPISIEFGNLGNFPGGLPAKCVQFYANGSQRIVDPKRGSLCESSGLGHFSIAVSSSGGITPPPSPGPSQIGGGGGSGFNRTWKIVAEVVGGLVGVLLVLMLILWLRRLRRRERMGDMVERSEGGETLKSQKVGGAHLPVASMVRTRPVLESEYAPQSSSTA